MVDFPAPLSPTNPTRSPGSTRNESSWCAARRPTGVGERHAVELHHRRERAVELDRLGRRLDLRMRVQHREDVVRRGPAHHAVVQQRAEIRAAGRNTSMPIIRTTSSTSRLISPCVTRQAPNAEHRRAPHRDAGVGEAAGSASWSRAPTSCSGRPRAPARPAASRAPCSDRTPSASRDPGIASRNSCREPPVRLRPARAALRASQRWNDAGANRVNIANANISAATGRSRNASSTKTTIGSDEGHQGAEAGTRRKYVSSCSTPSIIEIMTAPVRSSPK